MSTAFNEFTRRTPIFSSSDPEEVMGLNARTILNFWTVIEGLEKEQWREIERKFLHLPRSATSNYRNLAEQVVGNDAASKIQFSSWSVPHIKYRFSSSAAILVSYELIAMHLLIDENRPIIVLPLFEL